MKGWLAQCPGCLTWGTITPGGAALAPQGGMATPPPPPRAVPVRQAQILYSAPASEAPIPAPALPAAIPLSAAHLAQASSRRAPIGIDALDRVLGGGLVDGSVVLLGGAPGAGKSTLLLQTAACLVARTVGTDAAMAGATLYASGEESAQQIALRADRLDIESDAISVLPGDNIDHAIALAGRVAPSVLVIDSIQTMRTPELDSPAGSVVQVGECARRLARFAKDTHTPVIIVGQVTKDGEIAGPKTLEHLVDVVLYLEHGRGDQRLLTSPKNRFAPTTEIGTLTMTERGLETASDELADALAERAVGVPGSAVFPMASGERVRLIEIQALVGPDKEAKGDAAPRGQLSISGLDAKRVSVILAILARHAGIDVTDRDVFVSATGGAKIADPAADLAIALAIASSYRDLPIDAACACWGELGLAGEVRAATFAEARRRECHRYDLGAITGKIDGPTGNVRTLADAIAVAIGEAVAS